MATLLTLIATTDYKYVVYAVPGKNNPYVISS